MRHIIVDQGNEFKIKVENIGETDIFLDAYNQAASRVEDIVTTTEIHYKSNNNETYGDYLNNIIAFSGERGQGKSSAMLSFTKNLLDADKEKSIIEYGTNTKKYQFVRLDTIDPSTFEDMNNILEVVIARMYNRFEERYRGDNTTMGKDQKNRILILFQKVYESLCLIRNSKKLEELEYDYEGSIDKIAHIGDSAMLQKNIIKLVQLYLEIFTKGKDKSCLIIPIDDLDINIKHAYKIAEQIRKYLIVPNVIIIMAIKIEQLKLCVEKEYREQFSHLIAAPNHRIHDDEPTIMAAKYVEKLIPDGRKITLPEIRAISQSGDDEIRLIYNEKGSGDNQRKDILGEYKEMGIEKTLLRYIYDKTKIVFVKPENGLHNIIPNTLREVVNLLAVLGKMNDLKDSVKTRDEKELNSIRLENIKLFEDYILNTWVPNNLDEGNIRIIRNFCAKNTFEKHRQICVDIMDIIEKGEMYTVDKRSPLSPLEETFESLKIKLSQKNTNIMSYSLGDATSLMKVLSVRYINSQMVNFVFALKTLYTITMQKIILMQALQFENSESGDQTDAREPNNIYKFIGGDLWGYNKKKTIRGNRGVYEYDARKLLGSVYPEKGYYSHNFHITKEIVKAIFGMTFFSDFPNAENYDADIIYLQRFISDNYQVKKSATFCIDNIFISSLDLDYLEVKSGLRLFAYNSDENKEYIALFRQAIKVDLITLIVTNFELGEYIQHFCEDKNDLRKGVTDEPEKHFLNFVKNVTNAFRKINNYIDVNAENLMGNAFNEDSAEFFKMSYEAKIALEPNNSFNIISSIMENIYNGKLQEVKSIGKVCTAL